MKNVIIGITGGFIILYTVVICLSIYGSVSRSNEMEHGLSRSVETVLLRSYQTSTSHSEVLTQVEQELQQWIASESEVEITLKVCDLQKGILSVEVIEQYRTPFGAVRKKQYEKTAIIETA